MRVDYFTFVILFVKIKGMVQQADSVHIVYNKFILKEIRFKDMEPRDYHKMLRTFQRLGLYTPKKGKDAYLSKTLSSQELVQRRRSYRKAWLSARPGYNNKYWNRWSKNRWSVGDISLATNK
jgi:hypothetical protein